MTLSMKITNNDSDNDNDIENGNNIKQRVKWNRIKSEKNQVESSQIKLS